MMHTSVGGHAVRVRVTNRLGRAPLQLTCVAAALQESGAPKGAGARAGTMRTATFRHTASVTVAAGQDVVGDPVQPRVAPDSNPLITLCTPVGSGPATYHHSAPQTSFLAPDGDHTAQESGAAYTATTSSWYYVTGVDVLGAPRPGQCGRARRLHHRRLRIDVERQPPPAGPARGPAARAAPAALPRGLNAGIAGNRVLAGPQAMADAIDLRDLCPAR
ncbi:hypothetical protein ACFYOY_28900 [Streptomyces sp. NPDC007875]|uniref:hypothetical protein n=1 Tax=Streptomyces sp. NPDC007875 TaxID=3364783 RepID=UPI0036966A2C